MERLGKPSHGQIWTFSPFYVSVVLEKLHFPFACISTKNKPPVKKIAFIDCICTEAQERHRLSGLCLFLLSCIAIQYTYPCIPISV